MDAIVKPFPVEETSARRPTQKEAEEAVRTLLRYIGDNPDREGLKDTPRRVVKSYAELYSGYSQDPEDVLGRTFEEVGGYDNIVLVKDIPFFSHCEHHMVPIIGKAHIGYLPGERLLGLSKLARALEMFSRDLQVQERLTKQVADWLLDLLNPRGVGVVLEAEHLCMSLRGVQSVGTTTRTATFYGDLAVGGPLRDQFPN